MDVRGLRMRGGERDETDAYKKRRSERAWHLCRTHRNIPPFVRLQQRHQHTTTIARYFIAHSRTLPIYLIRSTRLAFALKGGANGCVSKSSVAKTP
jgi:hypothetical protein